MSGSENAQGCEMTRTGEMRDLVGRCRAIARVSENWGPAEAKSVRRRAFKATFATACVVFSRPPTESRKNNNHHCHSGLALFRPGELFFDRVTTLAAGRQNALDRAYGRHPERFVQGPPKAGRVPAILAGCG